MKKFLPILLTAIFLAAGCQAAQNSGVNQPPHKIVSDSEVPAAVPAIPDKPQPTPRPEDPAASVHIPKNNTQVAIKGKVICLPHKDKTGPQTEECAIGFVDAYGNNYALKDQPPGWSGDTAVGLFTNDTQGRYDIVGVIDFKVSDK